MLKVKRHLNIDLLRIVAMLMVVTLHFIGKGGLLDAVQTLSPQYFVVLFFQGISIVAVNCYVLISGYFLIKSKFKFSKFFALIAQVLFYSVFIYLILLATGRIQFSTVSLFKAFFPILTNEYWFITAYIGMYLLSPFVNTLIQNINKKQHAKLLLILVGLFSAWPTLLFFFWRYHSVGDAGYGIGSGYSVTWFLVLYITAAYIRLYYKPDYKLKKHLLRYIIFASIIPLCTYIAGYLFVVFKDERLLVLNSSFYAYNFLPTYIASIALFMLFLNMIINNNIFNKIIAFLSPLTLGVYLIHQNQYVSTIIWQKLQVSSQLPNHYFILFAIMSIIAIYITCSMIDWFRIKLFGIIGRTRWFGNFYGTISKLVLKITERYTKKIRLE